MNPYLIDLLLKINNCRMEGKGYQYEPKYFDDQQNALREEDGLQELEGLGFIELLKRVSHERITITKFSEILVTSITYKGNNFIRDYLTSQNVKPLEEAIKNTQDIYQQAQSHLVQARKHISSTHDERSRKDALRDCASAMEALVKKITGEKDLKDAIKNLRGQYYGSDAILKDSLAIWQAIHVSYPDVRHGTATMSDLSESEALYWIERILALINYLSRVKRSTN